MSFLLLLAAFQGSDQPKFRDCVPGLNELNCGSGVRSPSLPPSRIKCHHFQVHQTGTLGVKSARNPQDWSRRGGRRGEGESKELGEADCRETAPGTPSPGTWPWAPSPKRGPALPGVALSSPPRPAPALQLCVPRRVGCKISSQALAACSVFPNPPVGEGGSLVRIRVPPPSAPAGPLVQLGVSCPRSFPNSFPFPTLAPAPPSPTSVGSQIPSSGWRGQVDSTILARRW